MTSVEFSQFICQGCGIRLFARKAVDYKSCPYCLKTFDKKIILRPMAEEHSLPLPENVQRKTEDHLYKKRPRVVTGALLTVSILLLLVAVGMQCGSVDDYIFQPLAITVYSLIMLIFVLSRFLTAAFYKPLKENGHRPSLSVLVPCMNEEKVVRQTIESIFSASYPEQKLEVLCVNDGSSDHTLEKMLEALTRHQNLVVIDFLENKGLCHAWAVSSLMANGEIVVCVDSDTFILPGSLDKLVQGFEDPSVGGVSGHCDIENAQTNLLTRMQDVRYFFSYKIMKAAESVTGTVSCLPGCFSAYRKVCLLGVLNEWMNAKVMGSKGNFADDRSLTNLILKDYRVIYDDRALATTIAPDKWSVYVRQQARWNRSYLREVMKASRWMWKKHPLPALAWYTMMWMPLVEPYILVLALAPFIGAALAGVINLPWSYMLGIAAITGSWTLYYLAKTGRKGWWAGFIYTASYLVFFSWQVYWALLTLRSKKWGTRSAITAQDGSKKRTKTAPDNPGLAALNSPPGGIQQGWLQPVAVKGHKIRYAGAWILFLFAASLGIKITIPLIVDYGIRTHKVVYEGLAEKTTTALHLKEVTSFDRQQDGFGSGLFKSKKSIEKKHLRFHLGIGLVQLPIVYNNDPADVRLFFKKCDQYEANGAKKAALALAQGYLTLLYFSKIEETFTKNAQEKKALDEIIAAFGPNSLLATSIQESMLSLPRESGYFQLDFKPIEVPGNEWIDGNVGFWKYCAFLENVSREITINGDPAKRGKVLGHPDYRPDLTAFCCSAILQGYYHAGTWMALTKNPRLESIRDKIMKLALNYSVNSTNHRTVIIELPGHGPRAYTYHPSQILMRIFVWCYNRGRFTDSLTWEKPEWKFHVKSFFYKYHDGQTALEDLISYVPQAPEQRNWQYPWGARYLYQIPAIASELEQYANMGPSSRYTADISLQDVKDYLDRLKPLYPEKALNAGIQKAEKKFGGQSFAYDSEKFFYIFAAIVKAIIEASALYSQ